MIVGATGVAGQQFLASLANHPGFEVVKLAASSRSAGKTYREALTDPSGAFRWYCREPLDPAFARLEVQEASQMDATKVEVVFTAVESDAAKTLEPLYAPDKRPVRQLFDRCSNSLQIPDHRLNAIGLFDA